jgi:hypothetical protein
VRGTGDAPVISPTRAQSREKLDQFVKYLTNELVTGNWESADRASKMRIPETII